MKNYMKIDDATKQIIMDKTFFQKSRIIGSTEYKKLQAVRRDYPDYTPVRREIRKPDHAIDRHKGLTYDFMEYYISKYEPVDSRADIIALFEQMKDIAKAHAAGRSYNTIRDWFRERYPEVDSFQIAKTQEELAVEEAA